jgi:hypothetical protein
MTDYHPLIARAVEGLDKGTGETRRALYERARTALVTQLRSVEPALSETEITKERLALEDAIRKVEAEVARKSRAELREPRPPMPAPRRDRISPPLDKGRAEAAHKGKPAPRPDVPEGAEAPRQVSAPSARERLLGARAPSSNRESLSPSRDSLSPNRDSIKAFRGVVHDVQDLGAATAKAVQSARATRDSYGVSSTQNLPADDEAMDSSTPGFEPEADVEELSAAHNDSQRLGGREAFSHLEDEAVLPLSAPQPAPIETLEDEHPQARPPRSYRGLVKLLVVLIILAGVAATISWQWSNLTALYQRIAQFSSKQPAPTTQTQTTQPKLGGRVPQEQSANPPPGAAPDSQNAPAVAQRVVLYEEDPNDPQGKRYVGSVIWRTETVSPGPGLAPELAVRADVEIPERRMTVTWSMRRNTDQALPASHTIEIMFTLPADFPGGGIANVPGILMKQSEQARGTPLAGLAVKVTNGFFLIGLSAVETDMQRNIQLLKERPWFDIPVVYTNGGRAILAMEKGTPGDRAFAEAFAAWEKK